jgi:hypothetical protein
MIQYSKWLSLPLTTRQKIAGQFGITQVSSIEVFANTVKSDGYLVKDIEDALTREKMEAYIGRKSDSITDLFEWVVQKIDGKYIEPITVPGITTSNLTEVNIKPHESKKSRKK